MGSAMESIDKRQLKKMMCPKCNRPKLRFEHSADGIAPDGGSSGDRDVRCDACRAEFQESDANLQTQWQKIQAERTPPPMTGRH
jgi:ribosomal protein L37AE/L43A